MRDFQFALVTGGGGFIGSHLVDELLARGLRVRAIDNFKSGSLRNLESSASNPNFELSRHSLLDRVAVLKAVNGPSIAFHFAANPEVRVSTVAPAIHFSNNVTATFNLLEAVRRSGSIRTVVFASSSSVYGETGVTPADETRATRPVSVYGASKAACEELLRAYGELYGIKVVALRFANVVGSRSRHGVIYDLIQKLARNPRSLEILGDGKQLRGYLEVGDAIRAVSIALEKSSGRYSVFNVTSGDWLSVKRVAQLVVRTLGLKKIEFSFKPLGHGVGWPGDIKRLLISPRRLNEVGFAPIHNSSEAVLSAADITVKETRAKGNLKAVTQASPETFGTRNWTRAVAES